MSVELARDPERPRRIIGVVLYVVLMLAGAAELVDAFVITPLSARNSRVIFESMGVGALLAFPALLVYLWLPWVIDRFDPEPWWALALALAWGAIAACGFAAMINTGVEDLVVQLAGGPKSKHAVAIGQAIGACVSAPLVEEFFKGLAVFGLFFFLRREFDGVVDGIIYATFVALGFAATENVIYYARAGIQEAMHHQHNVLAGTFVLRGVLSPWGHPLYTSMTGIGFGVAREAEKNWLRWVAPISGYLGAVFLHFVWNGAATWLGQASLVLLPIWFLFVLAFIVMVMVLVARKGRIIRQHLRDEVLIGTLTQQELEMVGSPIGRWRARVSYGGAAGAQFVAAAARLGLCKWHTARAMKGQKRTVSMDFIAPLRQELARLRQEAYAKMGRAMPPVQGFAAGLAGAGQAPPPAPPPPAGYSPATQPVSYGQQAAPAQPSQSPYGQPSQGQPPQGYGPQGGGWPPRR